MKFRIVVTEKARKDLDNIMGYIALDAPQRAENFIDALLNDIRSLRSMPRRCAIAPESGRRGYEMRHMIHGRYRIIFTIKKSDVFILRVIHGGRLLD